VFDILVQFDIAYAENIYELLAGSIEIYFNQLPVERIQPDVILKIRDLHNKLSFTLYHQDFVLQIKVVERAHEIAMKILMPDTGILRVEVQ
jgi:hypothetical protein